MVFLPLIFFTVTTRFTKQSKLIIKQHEVSDEVTENNPQLLHLALSAEGGYSLNGKSLINRGIGTIMAVLKQAAEGDIPVPASGTADANDGHQAFFHSWMQLADLDLNS